MPEADSPAGSAASAARLQLDNKGKIERRTRAGRLKMLLVLAVCAAPVIASYLTYFVIRPNARTNYSELVQPLRPMPNDLPLTDLKGGAVPARGLMNQWLLVVVSAAACEVACEKLLWVQRQLRETLGREKGRVDTVWLIDDAGTPRPQTLAAVKDNTDAVVLRSPATALSAWLKPTSGQALENRMYIIDPMGNLMMRVPADPDPAKLKRDLDKLLRGSAGWDRPGRTP